jgi:arginine:agmatine antiporter
MAYGNFAGFLVAWGYWISIWASVAVIALAFAGSLSNLAPALHNRAAVISLTLGSIWVVVLINLRGVRSAGVFAELTTYAKLIPFAAVAVAGLFYVESANYRHSTERRTAARVRGCAGAAYDVRVPRSRVGDGAGR